MLAEEEQLAEIALLRNKIEKQELKLEQETEALAKQAENKQNLEKAYEENKMKEQKFIEVGRHYDIDFQQADWIHLQIEDMALTKKIM